jgi:(p)ppGpp synthase/HD superfamily hydrolase
MNLVEAARLFALGAHGATNPVSKYTGELYADHLEEVTTLMKLHGGSETAIAAAWLHDVVEGTQITHETIEYLFGNVVAKLVYG